MLVNRMSPDFVFEDERGALTQLVHSGYCQFNVITSLKGSIRGKHYHKINTEAFYVVSGKLRLFVKKGEIEEIHEFKKGDMFRIDPFVVHTFEYVEDTVLASMYDKGVEIEGCGKDIWTDIKE